MVRIRLFPRGREPGPPRRAVRTARVARARRSHDIQYRSAGGKPDPSTGTNIGAARHAGLRADALSITNPPTDHAAAEAAPTQNLIRRGGFTLRVRVLVIRFW